MDAMRAYSNVFRREVLAACDDGGMTRIVAARFQVSEAWVRRIKQERREQGKTAPRLTRRRTPTWMKEADQIRAAIVQSSDLTLDELKGQLQISLSRTTLCRELQRLKLTLKKSPEGHGAAAARCRPGITPLAMLRRIRSGVLPEVLQCLRRIARKPLGCGRGCSTGRWNCLRSQTRPS